VGNRNRQTQHDCTDLVSLGNWSQNKAQKSDIFIAKEVGGFPFQRKWTAFLGLILTLLETTSVHTDCRSCPALPDPGTCISSGRS